MTMSECVLHASVGSEEAMNGVPENIDRFAGGLMTLVGTPFSPQLLKVSGDESLTLEKRVAGYVGGLVVRTQERRIGKRSVAPMAEWRHGGSSAQRDQVRIVTGRWLTGAVLIVYHIYKEFRCFTGLAKGFEG